MKRFEMFATAWFAPATETEMTRFAKAMEKHCEGRAKPEINRVGYSGTCIRDTQTGRKAFLHGQGNKALLDGLNDGNAGALSWFERTAK